MSDPVEHSRAYLRAVRTGEDPDGPRSALASLSPEDLAAALDDDRTRTAVWLNVYNAAVQDLLSRDPSLFEDRRSFFGAERLTVAGRDLSLDDVEHGLLRRSQLKVGLGYLRNPFPDEFERRFRVRDPDPRIHFALNCGAAACPAVAGYAPDRIDEQLDRTSEAYLSQAVEYEPDRGVLFDGVVRVPRQFLWFRGDFGGKSGVLAFLRRYDLLPDGVRPWLSHRKYDWSLAVGRFADEARAGGDDEAAAGSPGGGDGDAPG